MLKENISAKAIAKAKGKITIKCGTSTKPPVCQGDECACDKECKPPKPPTCEEKYSKEECNPKPPTCEEKYSEKECNPKPPTCEEKYSEKKCNPTPPVCEHNCKPQPPVTPPETPETPVDNVTVVEGKGGPEALPDTGPGAVIATFVGVSSLGSLAYSAFTRRFNIG
jgi:hypothetical protein